MPSERWATFLLCGQPVFGGESVVEVCGHHLHTTPMPPSERLGHPSPEALDRVILSCLAKDPKGRPPSAGALLETLEHLPGLPEWTQAEARERWEQRAARCELPGTGAGPVDNRAPETVSSPRSAGASAGGPDRS